MGNNAINNTFPACLVSLGGAAGPYIEVEQVPWTISTWQTNFCFPMLRIFDGSPNKFSSSLLAKFMKAGE